MAGGELSKNANYVGNSNRARSCHSRCRGTVSTNWKTATTHMPAERSFQSYCLWTVSISDIRFQSNKINFDAAVFRRLLVRRPHATKTKEKLNWTSDALRDEFNRGQQIFQNFHHPSGSGSGSHSLILFNLFFLFFALTDSIPFFLCSFTIFRCISQCLNFALFRFVPSQSCRSRIQL